MGKPKIKTCSECGNDYEITFSRCPHCHKPNEDRPFTRLSYLPILRQSLLFLVGLLGINFFALLISLIVATTIKDDNALTYLIVNSITYVLIFIADIFIVWNYYPELFFTFKKYRTYIAGIIGFGVLLGGSMLIGFIMSKAVPQAGTGGNQSVAEMMVIRNPAVCILVLGIIGPLVEELTYRVGLFTLCKRASTILAYALTIIIFTVIHLDFFSGNIVNELVALPDYLFAATIFCILYHREGFGASFLAHALNNLFSVISIIVMRNI